MDVSSVCLWSFCFLYTVAGHVIVTWALQYKSFTSRKRSKITVRNCARYIIRRRSQSVFIHYNDMSKTIQWAAAFTMDYRGPCTVKRPFQLNWFLGACSEKRGRAAESRLVCECDNLTIFRSTRHSYATSPMLSISVQVFTLENRGAPVYTEAPSSLPRPSLTGKILYP